MWQKYETTLVTMYQIHLNVHNVGLLLQDWLQRFRRRDLRCELPRCDLHRVRSVSRLSGHQRQVQEASKAGG